MVQNLKMVERKNIAEQLEYRSSYDLSEMWISWSSDKQADIEDRIERIHLRQRLLFLARGKSSNIGSRVSIEKKKHGKSIMWLLVQKVPML